MKNLNTLQLSTADGHYFINHEEIVRLEASSNYTRIYLTNNTKVTASKVLKEFVAALEPFGFVRTHRTHMVNRQHISRITPQGNIIMRDSSVAEISRRMKRIVMRTLKAAA